MADARAAETPPVKPIIARADYTPPAFLVIQVALDFDLDPSATLVRATLTLQANPEAVPAPVVTLDGSHMELLELQVNGQVLSAEDYTLTDTQLSFAAPATADTFEVNTCVQLAPDLNTALEGLYVSSGNFCTQCEASGFRRITYFPDRPDIMTPFRVRMKADKQKYPVLLSNGNLVHAEETADGAHIAVWEDPFPKSSYLFALVAGDLASVHDTLETASGRTVGLYIYVEHGKEAQCAYAMDSLKRSMTWDEQAYGLEYDLDRFNIVAVSDFTMGAMENKSLNIFNDRYILADPDTATDADYANIEGIVAHEYFHNWTGNRVTCRDWFQLTLKEGLTVYRDQRFSSDMRSAPVERIQNVSALRSAQFPEDAGPLAHPIRPEQYIEVNNFYTATVYQKGAEVIGMYETLLGRDGFRAGMDLYFDRHDGQAVTCNDFRAAMADANGADLAQFENWYAQAGTPEVCVELEHDTAATSARLHLRQRTPPTPGQTTKQPLHIPFRVGVLSHDGKPLSIEIDGQNSDEHLLVLTDEKTTVDLGQVGSHPPVLSLNRGFSAPVTVNYDRSAKDFTTLIAHDSDPFARWDAAQQYGLDLTRQAMREKLGEEDRAALFAPFVAAMGAVVKDKTLDPAFKALLLSIPSIEQIADGLAQLDYAGAHAARTALRDGIAVAYGNEFASLYEALGDFGTFTPDAASAGRRALHNMSLGYLAVTGHEAACKRAYDHFAQATNMTDRMGALVALNEGTSPYRAKALAEMETRYRDNPLVLDKWFALQATSTRADALQTVRTLMEHPAFSLKTPNRVYSLIRSFASGNPLRFHQADGSGYRFMSDVLTKVDALNPQVGARLAAAFGKWRRLDPLRQDIVKDVLSSQLARKNISPNVYEILHKTLNA